MAEQTDTISDTIMPSGQPVSHDVCVVQVHVWSFFLVIGFEVCCVTAETILAKDDFEEENMIATMVSSIYYCLAIWADKPLTRFSMRTLDEDVPEALAHRLHQPGMAVKETQHLEWREL